LTGPVSFMAVGFGPEATFEGAIVAELQRFEDSGMLRVLDVLFVWWGVVATRPGTPAPPTLVSQSDVDEVAGALQPGHAAGLLLLEHVWQSELELAIAATGGEVLQQGLLTTEQTQALAR
jgi:hypothetical protein